MNATCRSCPHARPVEPAKGKGPDRQFICRANAPRPVSDGGAIVLTQWPVVRANDWCGQHPDRGLSVPEPDPSALDAATADAMDKDACDLKTREGEGAEDGKRGLFGLGGVKGKRGRKTGRGRK